MKIDVYGKPGCARCESTKTKLTHFLKKWNAEDKVVLDFVDMETADGLAKGVINDVYDVVPVTIVLGDDQQPLARWDGDVPPSADVARVLGLAGAQPTLPAADQAGLSGAAPSPGGIPA